MDGRSQSSGYRFSGVLRGYDAERGLMKVEPRNPFKKGMALEMVRPSDTVPFTVARILNEQFNEINETHGGRGCCYVPFDRDPGEFVLFREKMGS